MKINLRISVSTLAASLLMTVFFLFAAQQSFAQELGTSTRESSKEEVKKEKVKLDVEKAVESEKKEKTLQSTKIQKSDVTIDKDKSDEISTKEETLFKKSETDERLIEIKKKREEIELGKKNGKLTDKEYKEAINKLDKMEKELKGKSKLKLESKDGGC